MISTLETATRASVILENEFIDRWTRQDERHCYSEISSATKFTRKKNRIEREDRYSRNVIDVDWGVVKLALPGKK
jgi:hypothetical protein